MSHVYFIQAKTIGLIKIGLAAASLERRIRQLALHSPDALTVLGVIIVHDGRGAAVEAEHHVRFAPERAHGEWFRPSAALLNYIELFAITNTNAIERLCKVASFPTMPRGRPTKEMMRQRDLAGLEKWR